MNIYSIEEEIIEEFSQFSDWMEKYQYIIELGKELPQLDSKYRTDDNIVKGCQSKLWLISSKTNGTISFEADADAIIAKGLISLLLKVINNQNFKEIRDYDFGFIEKIGLKEHLSPNRANGLVSMIEQIKKYAN